MKRQVDRDYLDLDQFLIDPLLQAVYSEKEPSLLESETHYKARLKAQMHGAFEIFQKRLQKGLQILKQQKKLPSCFQDEIFLNVLNNPEKIAEDWSRGIALQETLQITDEEMLLCYQEGRKKYDHHAYREASDVFLVLCQLNPKVSAFWVAFGSAEEKCGDSESASRAYILAAELDSESLTAYVQAAKCLLELKRVEKARALLELALERAVENPLLAATQPLVEKMLQKMNKEEAL